MQQRGASIRRSSMLLAAVASLAVPLGFVPIAVPRAMGVAQHVRGDRQAPPQPPAPSAPSWAAPLLAAVAAGLVLGTAPAHAQMATSEADFGYEKSKLKVLQRAKENAVKRAQELAELSSQKDKALDLYKKLDEDRAKEIQKLEESIKKNQETRAYVLKDLQTRIGAKDASDEVVRAKASFEEFYSKQLEKEQKTKEKFAKEQSTRDAVLKDIQKTKREARMAAEAAAMEQQRIEDLEQEMADRVSLDA